ncbi:MAG TPA: hypothetical protein VFS62_13795 [Chloroflexota bacterium]|nr:hypothetical protein [Chloroflexota bacterium]
MPWDDDEVNVEKARRTHEGFRVLREKIAELKPDVLVVFSDDQLECFDFTNCPAFAIFVGPEFGNRPEAGPRSDWPHMGRRAEPGTKFPGHPELATALLTGVMQRGFDPAFCMDMPKPDRGIASGVTRTAEELTDWKLPIVPVMMNLYFAPQPTGTRCWQLGRAMREVIDEYPGDLRVGVVGSGGLWHTPGRPGSWLNEDFDRRTLSLLERGDARGMAEHFDSYDIGDDPSQDVSTPGRGITGMPQLAGPSMGTRETCAWIAAAALTEGSPTTIVDYIEAYASPVGNAFAYCEL